jgi:recombinational DNA repair protein RecR
MSFIKSFSVSDFTKAFNTEKDFIKDMLNMIDIHFDNQSNGIFMGGKVKLIDARP